MPIPRVAIISHEFPPSSIGGIATYCYDLARCLSKRGVHATVFCGRSKTMRIERINRYLSVVRLPCLDTPPRFLWFQIANYLRVSKLLKHFDVVHAANPLSSAAWFRAKADSNSRAFVTSIHGTALSELTAFVNTPKSEWTLGEFAMNVLGYPLNHHLIKICLENSDHVFVVGAATLRDTERSYLGWDRTRASVVRSGIDFEKFDGIQKDTVRRPQLIVYHGRLVSRKGVLHLVRAVAPLKKEFPALRLEIFGKGPLSDKVRHLVSDLNLKENVVLRGYVEYDKLIREICKASLVALPSLYEAQPISVLEAMACRKPVVVFDYPFSRECVVDSHNGLLAKPGDTQDLSEKIRLLLSNPEFSVELGENAYEFVRHRHDWKVLVEQYVRVYEALT